MDGFFEGIDGIWPNNKSLKYMKIASLNIEDQKKELTKFRGEL